MDLRYDKIEVQLAAALPELQPAAERYWQVEGAPGEDSGPYIFFEDMFGCFVEVLLAMPRSVRRDELLRRAFAFVDEMARSKDSQVSNLAFVGLYEGRPDWWFARAAEFIGPTSIEHLDQFDVGWRERSNSRAVANAEDRNGIIDLFGVRGIVAFELRADGVTLSDVPGATHLTVPFHQRPPNST